MKSLKLIAIISLLVVFGTKAQKFTIKGTAQNFEENTWLYLVSYTDALLDSTRIANGKFVFKGNSRHSGAEATLYTKDYKNRVPFWLEPKTTKINFKNSKPNQTIIIGSTIQASYQAITKEKDSINNRKDSLMTLIGKLKLYEKEQLNHEEIGKLLEKAPLVSKKYIVENPNSLLAALYLDENASRWGIDETKRLFNDFSENIKKSFYGQNINKFILTNKNFKVGDKYQDFNLLNLNGKRTNLSDVKGDYILLEFWSAWCGPCRGEHPELINIFNQFKEKGFNIIGISLDENKSDWIKAVSDDQLPWQNVVDLKGDNSDIAYTYGIDALPRKFLIDKNGIIVAKLDSMKQLKETLTELLK